jgi:uncharacterized repeat protein (TIGR02543 family)
MNNGTSGEYSRVSYTIEDDTIVLPSLTRVHYRFDGWYTDSTCSNAVDIQGLLNEPSNIVLYAKWIPNTYTITYNANGADGEMTPTTYKYAENVIITLKANAFTKENFKFIGWAATADGDILYLNSDSFMINGDKAEEDCNMTLYAIWIKYKSAVTVSSNQTAGHSYNTYDAVNFNLDVAALKAAGYTRIKVSISFTGKKIDKADYWSLKLFGKNSVEVGSAIIDFENTSDWRYLQFSFLVSLDNLDETARLILQWGASGNLDDDWTVGTINATAEAIA